MNSREVSGVAAVLVEVCVEEVSADDGGGAGAGEAGQQGGLAGQEVPVGGAALQGQANIVAVRHTTQQRCNTSVQILNREQSSPTEEGGAAALVDPVVDHSLGLLRRGLHLLNRQGRSLHSPL